MSLDLNAPSNTTIRDRSISAMGWGIGAGVTKIAAALAVQAVLARLVGPHEFGIFAVGLLVMGLAIHFADAGFSTSLIQRKDLTSDEICLVWTLNIAASTIATALVYTFAPFLASLFSKPEISGTLRIMAPAIVLTSAASLSLALLRRRLEFRTVQVSQLTGYALGYGAVSIVLASFMPTASALACGIVAQSVFVFAIAYLHAKHPVRLVPRVDLRSEHILFARVMLPTTLATWFVNLFDRLLVARLCSSEHVGLYNVAYNLVQSPLASVAPTFQSVTFSVGARLQDDRRRLKIAYLQAVQLVCVTSIPIAAAVGILAQPMVQTIYGHQFAPSAPLVSAFAILIPAFLLWSVSMPFLWNTGHRDKDLKLQLIFALISLPTLGYLAKTSLIALAWGAAMVALLRTLVVLIGILRVLGVTPREAATTVASGLVVLVPVVVVLLISETAFSAHSAYLRLGVGSGLVLPIMAIAFFFFPWVIPLSAREYLASWGNARLPACKLLWARFSASRVSP